MSYKSDKLKKALEAKGYTDVKVWYEPIGPALEMCGNSGGWMFSWAECKENCLSYNLDLSLEVINKMQKVEADNFFDDHLCVCPICKGLGSIKKPFSNYEKKTEIADKHSIARMLRESGYSIREIMKFLKYKSPNTVQSILKRSDL